MCKQGCNEFKCNTDMKPSVYSSLIDKVAPQIFQTQTIFYYSMSFSVLLLNKTNTCFRCCNKAEIKCLILLIPIKINVIYSISNKDSTC